MVLIVACAGAIWTVTNHGILPLDSRAGLPIHCRTAVHSVRMRHCRGPEGGGAEVSTYCREAIGVDTTRPVVLNGIRESTNSIPRVLRNRRAVRRMSAVRIIGARHAYWNVRARAVLVHDTVFSTTFRFFPLSGERSAAVFAATVRCKEPDL